MTQFDRNPLHAQTDPNDAAFVMCASDYLYGDIGDYASRVLSQIGTGKITARFGMIALAALEIRRKRAARQHALSIVSGDHNE